MYERLLLFGYVLYGEFVAASHTRFVKSWYDAVDIIFLYSPYVTIINETIKDAGTNPIRFMRKPIKSDLLIEISCSK